LIGYQGSNIYRIWILQNDKVIIIYNIKFKEDKIFDPKNKPTYKYYLQVYRADSDEAEPISDIHYQQD